MSQERRDQIVPLRAIELIMRGVPPTTVETYRKAWRLFLRWCDATGRTPAPVTEATMLAYLAYLSLLPFDLTGLDDEGVQSLDGRGKRPAPPTVWIWYSAVRRYHRMSSPPIPWECGDRLATAIVGYTDEMIELGWVPNKAPRAHPEDVRRMVLWCSEDLDVPRRLQARAIILGAFHTAGRASDMATYRIGDVTKTGYGLDFLLRASKNMKRGKMRTTAVYSNRDSPTYDPRFDPALAVLAWVAYLRARGITDGPLFRPLDKWENLRPVDRSYKLSGQAITNAVAWAAAGAGVDAALTCHSLRRGWVTWLRELGDDFLAIARAYGWSERGSLHVYMEEAERGMPNAAGRRAVL